MSYLKHRYNAIGFALQGLRQAFKQEVHVKQHVAIAVLVIIAGLCLGLSIIEWFMVSASIALVIAAELFNSALEKLCNLVQPNVDPNIKYIKDVSAAAVLVVCLLATVAALLVFVPHIKTLF